MWCSAVCSAVLTLYYLLRRVDRRVVEHAEDVTLPPRWARALRLSTVGARTPLVPFVASAPRPLDEALIQCTAGVGGSPALPAVRVPPSTWPVRHGASCLLQIGCNDSVRACSAALRSNNGDRAGGVSVMCRTSGAPACCGSPLASWDRAECACAAWARGMPCQECIRWPTPAPLERRCGARILWCRGSSTRKSGTAGGTRAVGCELVVRDRSLAGRLAPPMLVDAP